MRLENFLLSNSYRLFVIWAAKFIDWQKIYFFGQQFYSFLAAKFINGQQLLKHSKIWFSNIFKHFFSQK
jgi:hypothetical protein